ncbi:MAG: DCC1-like thiol-disulfide oxidoreductase family protein [Pseudomonadota bacterium]
MTTVVFDTDCVLCSGWVHRLIRYERAPTMRFVSAWSDEGLALASGFGMTADDLDETFLVVQAGKPLTHSDAALALLAELRVPWRWATALRVIPRRWRNAVYSLVAGNRYRWFGHQTQCFVPPADQAHRFVSGPGRPE